MNFHPSELFYSPGFQFVAMSVAYAANTLATATATKKRSLYTRIYGKNIPVTEVNEFLDYLEPKYILPELVTLPVVLDYAKHMYSQSDKGSVFHTKLHSLYKFVRQATNKTVWPNSFKRFKRKVAEHIAMGAEPRLKKFYHWLKSHQLNVDTLTAKDIKDYDEWLCQFDYIYSSRKQYAGVGLTFARMMDKTDAAFPEGLLQTIEMTTKEVEKSRQSLNRLNDRAYRSVYDKGFSFPLRPTALVMYLNQRGETARESGTVTNRSYYRSIINRLARVSMKLGYEDIRAWSDIEEIYNDLY